jgi:hypothetical protein
VAFLPCREFSFVRQQQVAAKLSKLLPGGPHSRCSWWMVCSLALQVGGWVGGCVCGCVQVDVCG